jgi:tRNA pseudouridine13 synthase
MRLLTAALPGTGGLHKAVPEDFVVDELPAYPPSGEGTHTFLHIEKRELTTDEALERLSAALGCRRDDAGSAGAKDRQAIARQWVSLPGIDPARAQALALDGVRVLAAVRHPHKLRTGHLRGNRFQLTLRGTTDGVARARAVLEALRRGAANYFGAQRFGARGDNAAAGRALIIATHPALRAGAQGKGPPIRSRSQRRMLVSAYQSSLFNRYLDRRIDDALLHTAIAGDVLKKTDTGGLFTPDDLAEAQARLDSGALTVTGPMFGHKMMSPPDGTPARAREDALLAEEGLTPAAFVTLGKLAEGTRRPLLIPIGEPAVTEGPEPGAIVVTFVLPPGAYATGVLAEIMKDRA